MGLQQLIIITLHGVWIILHIIFLIKIDLSSAVKSFVHIKYVYILLSKNQNNGKC